MGMYAQYWRITPQQWQDIAEDTEAADVFFGYDLDDEDDDGWDAFFELRRTRRHHLDIERAWHALYYLLTGDSNLDRGNRYVPLSYVVLGANKPAWDEDYGIIVGFLTPAQVKETWQALQKLTRGILRSRLNAEKFNAAELYGGNGWRPSDMELLLAIYDKVAAFFQTAAQAGEVILIQVA